MNLKHYSALCTQLAIKLKESLLIVIYVKLFPLFSEKAQEVKAIAEQGLNTAKEKCKVQ